MAQQDFILNVITRFRAQGTGELGAAFRRELASIANANLSPKQVAQQAASTQVAGERHAQDLQSQGLTTEARAFRREMRAAFNELPAVVRQLIQRGVDQGALGRTARGEVRQFPTTARAIQHYDNATRTPQSSYQADDRARRLQRSEADRDRAVAEQQRRQDEAASRREANRQFADRQRAEAEARRSQSASGEFRPAAATLNRRGDSQDGVARSSDSAKGVTLETAVENRRGRAQRNREAWTELANNDEGFQADREREKTSRQQITAGVNRLLADLGEFAKHAAAAAREMARVRAQVAEIRANDTANLDALADERRFNTHAQAGVAERLADSPDYADDRSRIDAANNRTTAESQRQTRDSPDRMRAAEDAAIEKRITTSVRETAVLNRLTAAEESLLREEAMRQVSQRRYSRALQRVSGSIERADNDGGSMLPGGTNWQRLQAFASQRATGQVEDPRRFQTFGQGIASRAVTTAGYGISGAAMYGGVSAVTEMIREASELDRIMASVRQQFNEIDDAASFPQFRRSMLEIARESGVAADEVATVGFQMRGAFDTTQRAVDETRAAIRASVVTGIEQRELSDSLTGAAISYDTSIEGITDKAIGLEERFGVLARESLKVFGDMASSADEAGLSLDELGAILGTIQQASGRSGVAIAESLGRIMPAIGENSSAIVQAYQLTPELQGQSDEMATALGQGETGQVLTSLLRNWHSLDRGTQQYFTTLLGGRREAQTLNALFNNSSEALAELDRTQSDTGKTTERFNDIQSTLISTAQRMQQEFIQIGDSLARAGLFDALKLIAGAALAVIQVVGTGARMFADFNEALGSAPGRIMAVVAALIALRGAMRLVGSARSAMAEVRGGGGTLRTAALETMIGMPVGTMGGGRNGGGVGGVVAAEVAEEAILGGGGNARDRRRARRARERAQRVAEEAAEAVTEGIEVGAERGMRRGGRGAASRMAATASGLLPSYATWGEAFPTARRVPGAVAGAATTARGALQTGVTGAALGAAARSAPGALAGGARAALSRAGGFLRGAGPLALIAADLALIDKFFSDRQKLQEDLGSARATIEQSLREKSYGELQTLDDSGLMESTFAEKLGSWIGGETNTDTLLNRAQDEKRRQMLEASKRNPEILAAMSINTEDVERILKQMGEGGDTGREAGEEADAAIGRVEGANRENLDRAAGQVSKQEEGEATNGQSNLLTMQQTQAAYDAGEIGYDQWLRAMQAEVHTLHEMAKGGVPEKIEASLQAQRQLRQGITANRDQELERGRLLNELAGGGVQGEIDLLMGVLRDNADKVGVDNIVKRTWTEKSWDQQGKATTVERSADVDRRSGKMVVDEDAPNFNPATQVRRGGMTDPQVEATQFAAVEDIRQRWMETIENAPSVQAARDLAAAGPQFTPEELSLLESLGKERADALKAMFGLKIDEAQAIRDRELGEALGGINVRRAQSRDPAVQAALDAEAAETTRRYADGNVDKLNGADVEAAQAAQSSRQVDFDIERSQVGIQRARAAGDPIAEARAAQADAAVQRREAQGGGDAAINQAIAAQIEANNAMRAAQADVATARIELVKAQRPGDALAQARAMQEEADIAAREARGPAAQLRAQAARITADRAVEDAIEAARDAQDALLSALAEQQGDQVESAAIAVRGAQRDLDAARRRGDSADVTDQLRAALVSAEYAAQQASMSHEEELINFDLEMGYITEQAAIARWEGLLAVAVNDDQRRELMMKIRQLRESAKGMDLGFNLPDIDMPTLYTARRMNQDMQREGQSFANAGASAAVMNDNRQIQVVLNASNAVDGQAALQTIVEALNEAPRFGTQARLY